MATFNQRVNLHSDKAKCCLATFNQHYHFACKNALGHFHPSKHFAISSMCRKAKSPVTVCGNSRNVTFCSLERQNRKWPLSATDRRAYINAMVFFEFANAGILCKSKLLGGYKVSDVKFHPELRLGIVRQHAKCLSYGSVGRWTKASRSRLLLLEEQHRIACWSVRACSLMLLVRTESAPTIHLLL